ncbi:hypothetical protein [Kineosporia succinea]|uniref:DUF4352 domain-containing protein n=1 Tax=Kineosporia succinea TaxID=84632 RepID=A0ABT9P606_9ACTN|nr:hypothetical protein [Kineosporia succinea]MDP9828102.1 hypothetical protein [Kineosporia succinea]
MATTSGRNRTRGSAPRPAGRPEDSRGSWGGMLSALLVAGLIFAAAIMLHYGELPSFLAPATKLGAEETIEGELRNGPAAQKVTLVASVPAAPRVTTPKEPADGSQRLVTISVAVRNESGLPVPVEGAGQSLRTDMAHSYASTTEDVATVAAGQSKTVKLRFLVPRAEDPATLTLKVAGEQRRFDVS